VPTRVEIIIAGDEKPLPDKTLRDIDKGLKEGKGIFLKELPSCRINLVIIITE
jgi:hypothetical protein